MNPALERAYKVGVAFKGFDGMVELLAGLALLFVPGWVHTAMVHLTNELNESQTAGFIATYVARTNDRLVHDSLAVLIIFLLTHGIIKLVLVYCLLKEILWAYPYALAALGLFLIYQVYMLFVSPGFGMAVFALLDAIIIYLVWREWRVLATAANQT